MRLKICLYEFFVKTASFPIGAELSRKPRFFRQFGGVKRKRETYILIGVRHSDACKVCVAATGRLLGRCGIQCMHRDSAFYRFKFYRRFFEVF